jgi:hypothetical protein
MLIPPRRLISRPPLDAAGPERSHDSADLGRGDRLPGEDLGWSAWHNLADIFGEGRS